EQVAAAFRLAMADILAADHDGCLPIVFDDAFVNSDPARISAVQAMLDRAAERGLQVIVLSCNHRDYDGFGAATRELSRA
ncbi:MAG: ATP-binding protein, partial [Planctomycetaceae bacterium]